MGRLELLRLSVYSCLTALLIACGTPVTQIFPAITPTTTSAPVPTLTPAPTLISTATLIPGFENWFVFNERAVDIEVVNGAVRMTLQRRALWFMNERGVLFYKLVTGDFKLTADVHVAKSSDPAQPPGGDGSVQLGGLMARNGNPGHENYVFIVLGDDGNGLSVETKNTTNSQSMYNGPSWDTADAQLRLCRSGSTFLLYKRHPNASEAWQLAETYERPDLPAELQVGLNIYTDHQPDVQIQFTNIVAEAISAASACETD